MWLRFGRSLSFHVGWRLCAGKMLPSRRHRGALLPTATAAAALKPAMLATVPARTCHRVQSFHRVLSSPELTASINKATMLSQGRHPPHLYHGLRPLLPQCLGALTPLDRCLMPCTTQHHCSTAFPFAARRRSRRMAADLQLCSLATRHLAKIGGPSPSIGL